jgi:hypothetical protein
MPMARQALWESIASEYYVFHSRPLLCKGTGHPQLCYFQQSKRKAGPPALTLGAQFVLGGVVIFNSDTFKQIVYSNQACADQRDREAR